jgi:hypothetical protein
VKRKIDTRSPAFVIWFWRRSWIESDGWHLFHPRLLAFALRGFFAMIWRGARGTDPTAPYA